MNTSCKSDTLVPEQSVRMTVLTISRLCSSGWINYGFFGSGENYLLGHCTNVVKFKILQIMNIYAFYDKFNESRDHSSIMNAGLH